jgi:hypothetical protein
MWENMRKHLPFYEDSQYSEIYSPDTFGSVLTSNIHMSLISSPMNGYFVMFARGLGEVPAYI